MKRERGKGLKKETFYSTCSMHVEYCEGCPLCNTGTWHNNVKVFMNQRIFRFWPGAWRFLVNNRSSHWVRLRMLFR